MPRSANGALFTGDNGGAEIKAREPPVPAVEIRFYGQDPAITIPLRQAKAAAAQAFFERVKSDVIEAQRHNAPYVEIRPFGRTGDVLILDPSTIKQVVFVDAPPTDERRR